MKNAKKPLRINKSKKTKTSLMYRWRKASKMTQAGTFAALFAVVCAIFLIISLAASTTVTYTGKLSSSQPSVSYSVTAASGTISAALTLNQNKSVKVSIMDSAGTQVASAITSNKKATATAQVTPGTYKVTLAYIGTASKPVNYSVAITYPVNDTSAPVTVITSPTTTSVTGVVAFNANATDDTGVARVEFLVDGAVKFTDTASPYSYSWDTAGLAANSSHTLQVKAYDTSNNIGTASMTVTIGDTSVASCSGVNVQPGQFTQAFVNGYQAGTTFCLKAGTHVLTGSGILTRTGDKYIGETVGDSTTIIDGQNSGLRAFKGYGGPTGQQNVTVKNLVIKNFTEHGIASGWGWIIIDNELTGMGPNAQAIEMNDNTLVRNNTIHDNQWYAISGGPSWLTNSTFKVEFNRIYRNYLCGCHVSDGNNGATKFHSSGNSPLYGLEVRGNHVYDNYGVAALWSDGLVYATYDDNTVENNQGIGIFHEIGLDATISNNHLRDNLKAYVGQSCYYGNILLNNSWNTKIFGNDITAANGTNGICLVNVARSDTADHQDLRNVQVYDNTVKLATVNGVNGMSGLIDGSTVTDPTGVSFSSNDYYVKNTSGAWFAWPPTYPITWSAFQNAGQEKDSTSPSTIQLW